MKVFTDISYAENERCKLDIYLPETVGFETFVHFHGGGLEAGDKDGTREIAESFVKAGYGFVSANYRMYSHGAKFPDFLIDAAIAVSWVKNNIGTYGGNKESLYVSGQSAGAWLTLMLCLNREYLQSVGVDPLSIKGWISDSAQATSHYNAQYQETGRNQWVQRIDEYAPLYYVDEHTDFSKIFLIFYENDMPCRPEQNMLLFKAIKHFKPEAKIDWVKLEGGHCQGSCKKDEDGEFPYVKESLKWLNGEK